MNTLLPVPLVLAFGCLFCACQDHDQPTGPVFGADDPSTEDEGLDAGESDQPELDESVCFFRPHRFIEPVAVELEAAAPIECEALTFDARVAVADVGVYGLSRCDQGCEAKGPCDGGDYALIVDVPQTRWMPALAKDTCHTFRFYPEQDEQGQCYFSRLDIVAADDPLPWYSVGRSYGPTLVDPLGDGVDVARTGASSCDEHCTRWDLEYGIFSYQEGVSAPVGWGESVALDDLEAIHWYSYAVASTCDEDLNTGSVTAWTAVR